jgi:hypothetical protein
MSGDAPSRYPLAWPANKPRTPASRRKVGKFSSAGAPLSIAYAVGRVQREVDRLGGRYALLSSDLQLRQDGLPRSVQGEPSDPGICLYFQMAGKPYAMACDTYTKVAQNLAAIAAHIEATRAIERYGVATAAETLQAFQALPAPKRPHEILGVARDASEPEVRAAWRRLIAEHHPDQGGSEKRAAELNAARDAMLKASPNDS